MPDDYTVTGIFDVGYYDFDENVIAISLENAQDLYNLGDGVHGLMVMLRDPYQAAEVSNELAADAWTKLRHLHMDAGKLGDSRRARSLKKTSCFTCSFSSCSSPRCAS